MVLVFVPYWLIAAQHQSDLEVQRSRGGRVSQFVAFVPTTLNLFGAFLSVPFVYFLILLGAAAMKQAQARQEEEIQAGPPRASALRRPPRAAAAPASSAFPLQRAAGDLDAAASRSRHRRPAPGPPVRPAARDARRCLRADPEPADGTGVDQEVPGHRAGAFRRPPDGGMARGRVGARLSGAEPDRPPARGERDPPRALAEGGARAPDHCGAIRRLSAAPDRGGRRAGRDAAAPRRPGCGEHEGAPHCAVRRAGRDAHRHGT